MKKSGPLLVVIVTFLVIWVCAVALTASNQLLVPRPGRVLAALAGLAGEQQFWKDLGASFYRVTASFVLSFAVSYPLVLLSLLNDHVRRGIFIVVEFFRYLPIPVFIPLTILWFGIGDSGKIFIIFLGTFAQMIPMFYDAALTVSNNYQSSAGALRWNRWDMIKHVIVPGSKPLVWDSSRICFGWAWTYLVIAELLGAENGLGFAIIRSQRYLATDRIFAYVIVIGLIGLLTDRMAVVLRKKLFAWSRA